MATQERLFLQMISRGEAQLQEELTKIRSGSPTDDVLSSHVVSKQKCFLFSTFFEAALISSLQKQQQGLSFLDQRSPKKFNHFRVHIFN